MYVTWANNEKVLQGEIGVGYVASEPSFAK